MSVPPVARPDAHTAQIHRLSPRAAGIAKLMGFGRVGPMGTWLFSKAEEEQVRAASERRERERKSKHRNRKERPISRHVTPEEYVLDMMRGDPLNEVERILFRVALDLTATAAELHRAAQLMKSKRLEWEEHLNREARGH